MIGNEGKGRDTRETDSKMRERKKEAVKEWRS